MKKFRMLIIGAVFFLLLSGYFISKNFNESSFLDVEVVRSDIAKPVVAGEEVGYLLKIKNRNNYAIRMVGLTRC